jgi:hypothetical protein
MQTAIDPVNESITMKKMIAGSITLLLLAGCAPARVPAQNVDPGRHPNLAAAQRLCAEAFDKINAAQQANEWDMGGHAKKAKDLLVQASDEIKQAALAANAKGR